MPPKRQQLRSLRKAAKLLSLLNDERRWVKSGYFTLACLIRLCGDVDGLCEYESETADGIEKAFRDAVDDYIDACHESETTNGSSVL